MEIEGVVHNGVIVPDDATALRGAAWHAHTAGA
jgi:hypothetical protein